MGQELAEVKMSPPRPRQHTANTQRLLMRAGRSASHQKRLLFFRGVARYTRDALLGEMHFFALVVDGERFGAHPHPRRDLRCERAPVTQPARQTMLGNPWASVKRSQYPHGERGMTKAGARGASEAGRGTTKGDRPQPSAGMGRQGARRDAEEYELTEIRTRSSTTAEVCKCWHGRTS